MSVSNIGTIQLDMPISGQAMQGVGAMPAQGGLQTGFLTSLEKPHLSQ
jgi:hypothetical protein